MSHVKFMLLHHSSIEDAWRGQRQYSLSTHPDTEQYACKSLHLHVLDSAADDLLAIANDREWEWGIQKWLHTTNAHIKPN